MRLLRLDINGVLAFTGYFSDNNIPPYAILSHTWGNDGEEVTFEDIQNGRHKSKPAYHKLRFCGEQARKDGLEYFWVDTCCIQKSDPHELSMAIISMFRWYKKAAKCYVYLSDVPTRKRCHESEDPRSWESDFRNSRWFRRGWTLQELLAPAIVEFFSGDGSYLGSKETLEELLHEITHIPASALQGSPLNNFRVAERFEWAKGRQTSKPEDKSYGLQGIFNVFIPLMYGEGGDNAFARLMAEITKLHQSHSSKIFPDPTRPIIPDREHDHPSGIRENPLQTGRRGELLESLNFPQIDARLATIKRAHTTTCRWLLKHLTYNDWTDSSKLYDHKGLLWIHGKPGAGKSTLMKFAHAHAKKSNKDRPEDEIILSFFFNARGVDLEKSTIGMYRALLFQLLQEAQDIRSVLDEVPRATSAWSEALLQDLLSDAVAHLGKRRLKCFIDALDECDAQQVQDMILFCEELGQTAFNNGGQILICFSSRHYPTIGIRHGLQLTLETQEGHSDDLAKYIQNALRAGHGDIFEETKQKVQERANGIFMWAVLVVDILNKNFRNGRTFDIEKGLEAIAEKLSDLFKDILKRDSDNMDGLLLCIQWILYSKRPLTCEEFYFATVAGLRPDSDHLRAWDPKYIAPDSMHFYINSSSKGLAELTKSKKPTVQFIHESVRDFLIKDNGLYELWPELKLKGNLHSLCHDKLKQCCTNYLHVDFSDHILPNHSLPRAYTDDAKNLQALLASKFPFLEYAGRHVFSHAEEAAKEISQTTFLDELPLELCTYITDLFDDSRHTSRATLIYSLAEKNCGRLIRASPFRSSQQYTRGERYRYPLFVALAKGNKEAARALLQQDERATDTDLESHLGYEQPFKLPQGQSPLEWSLENNYEAIAIALLQDSDIAFKVKPSLYSDVLSLALTRKNTTSLEILLDEHRHFIPQQTLSQLEKPMQLAARGAHMRLLQTVLDAFSNVEACRSISKMRLIQKAAYAGNDETVQFLLEWFSKVYPSHTEFLEALDVVSSNCRTETVEWILQKGNIDVDTCARDLASALEAAARWNKPRTVEILLARIGRTEKAWFTCADMGHKTIIEILLARGANIDRRDTSGDTALIKAATSGHYETVKMLLERNADIEACNSDGNTALIKAATSGHYETVKMLLERNADIEASDESSNTALIEAAAGLNHKIVKLLLDWNANVNASDSNGRTALMIVAAKQKVPWYNMPTIGMIVEMIDLLLNCNATIEAGDNTGRTALTWAAEKCDSKVVKLLLDWSANIEARDNAGKTALMWAVDNGFSYTVEVLVNRHANIKARDNAGNTALMWAVQSGLRSRALETLLYRGANVEARNNAGETALMWAAYQGYYITLCTLLHRNANVEARNNAGETALMYAARQSDEKIVELLLDRSAQIDAVSEHGRSALIYAAASGSLKVVNLLLDKHANTQIADDEGYVALDHAIRNRQGEVVNQLSPWEVGP